MTKAECGSVVWVDVVDSTNRYVAGLGDAAGHGVMVCCREQTAGRGQRGNVWESAAGENVTGSLMLRPVGVAARCQFRISEAVALGVARAVDAFLPEGLCACVKWPNDIYVGDRKICGILIENVVGGGGQIVRSVAGVGLNVNQRVWLGDAPNPVSLSLLGAGGLSVEAVAERVACEVMALMDYVESEEGAERLHKAYMGRLWRGEGMHEWRDTATGEVFGARIKAVAPEGTLLLEDERGVVRAYGFKEVMAVL